MTALLSPPESVLSLYARTAADLMTPNPIAIRQEATVGEAVALLVDRGFTGAPVIDEFGRPVGVVTQTDILIRDRGKTEYVPRVPEYYTRSDKMLPGGERLPPGFHVEDVDRTTVAEIMTPGIFAVMPETPVARVIGEMVVLRVHRMFVVDHAGTLVGVIGLFDILRRLRP
jgi:predicted transcriptional regulator